MESEVWLILLTLYLVQRLAVVTTPSFTPRPLANHATKNQHFISICLSVSLPFSQPGSDARHVDVCEIFILTEDTEDGYQILNQSITRRKGSPNLQITFKMADSSHQTTSSQMFRCLENQGYSALSVALVQVQELPDEMLRAKVCPDQPFFNHRRLEDTAFRRESGGSW